MKYQQIKKIGVEGFSEKPSTPIFLFAYKRNFKRLKIFGAIFLSSILKKTTQKLFFIYSIWQFNLKVLKVSFSTVLFFKAVSKTKKK